MAGPYSIRKKMLILNLITIKFISSYFYMVTGEEGWMGPSHFDSGPTVMELQ